MPEIRKIALIIGVDSYHNKGPYFADLPSCKNDATDIANLLSCKTFGYEIFESNPIIGSKLNINNSFSTIQRAIVKFFKTADITSILLFYFSGHGIPRHDNDVFLATPEVDPIEPLIGGIRLSDLTELVNSSRARQVVCIIDSCYSGAANIHNRSLIPMSYEQKDEETLKSAQRTSNKILNNILRKEGRYFLLSTQSYTKSYAPRTNENLKSNSIYTKYLIEGLKGVKPAIDKSGIIIPYTGSVDDNGFVTPESLYQYINYNVLREAPQQEPVLKSTLSGDRIILAEYPSLSSLKTTKDPSKGSASLDEDLLNLLLDEKIENFNIKREQNQYMQLNFRARNLSHLKLSAVNLSKVDLTNADLSEATLVGANFEGANLYRTNLNHANLSKVDLTNADLSEATLVGANLEGANLNEANLHKATLVGANLSATNVSEVNFTDANLSFVNLDRSENLHKADLKGADFTKAKHFPISKREARSKGARVSYF